MQLDTYLDMVSKHLGATAALGDERTRQIAESLAAAAGPAVQLAVLGALSDAADEITSMLLDLPGSPTVAIRLDGGEALVDVQLSGSETTTGADDRREEADARARISLRLSEALKSDIDAAAAADGVSVNTWLVRSASAALNPNPFDSLAALGKNFGNFGAAANRARGGHDGQRGASGGRGGQNVTGWING